MFKDEGDLVVSLSLWAINFWFLCFNSVVAKPEEQTFSDHILHLEGREKVHISGVEMPNRLYQPELTCLPAWI